MRRRFGAVLLALAAARTAAAGYVDVLRADAAGDLTAARAAALETMMAHPEAPEAAAAAAWWLERVEDLPEPAAPLGLDLAGASPELTTTLADLAAVLARRPPAGTLATAELAGSFGSLDTLDIERPVVPPQDRWPAAGPVRDPDGPWRLKIGTLDGWIAPPEALLRPGVYLAIWSFAVPAPAEGFLLLEVDGAANLRVDGTTVDRIRPWRRLEPATRWYRVRFPAGPHRILVAFASRAVPRVRLRVLNRAGAALPVTDVPAATPPRRRAAVRPVLPPAERELAARLATDPRPTDLLAAAALARLRQDWLTARRRLEEAAKGEAEPLAHLELARLLMDRPTGGDTDVDARRAAAELDRAGDLPAALMLRYRLALASKRDQDAERLLDQLQGTAGDDPRVVRAVLRHAIRMGWTREIEEGMRALKQALGASPFVEEPVLEALEALDRVRQRNRLLERLADTDPFRPGLAGRLLDASRLETAAKVLQAVASHSGDLDTELELARLDLRMGRPRAALDRLRRERRRWGAVPRLDQLTLVAARMAGEREPTETLLQRLLAARPADLGLRMFAWSQGRRRFYEPFVRDPTPLLERARREAPQGADSVLVLDQAVERVFPDGTSIHYYHGVTLALTPEGAQQAADLNLLPDSELLTVRVIHPDGSSEIPSDLGPRLERVEPGDAVETEYLAVIPRASVPGGGHLSPYIYRFADAQRAFGLSEYVLLLPPGLRFNVDGNLEEVHIERGRRDGLNVVAYRVENAPPRPSEPLAPPEQELLPWVTYGFGVTWAQVGDLMRDRVLAALAPSPELLRWADRHLKPGTDPEAMLRSAVADLLERVRRGDRLLDLGTTAGAALARGEGNRLGILLAGLVAEPGWRVDLVLTRQRVYAGSHLDVPTTAAFGTPLVRVRAGSATIWLDLAEELRGVGHIRPQFQGSDGLLLPLDDPNRPAGLIRQLPEFPNPDLEERVELRGTLREDGSARLEMELVLRGAQSRRLLDAVRRLPKSRVEQLYAQLAASLFPGAREVVGRVEEAAGEFPHLVLGFTLDRACDARDGSLECGELVLAKPLSPILAALPARRYPLVLDLPVLRRYTVDLALPQGWEGPGRPRLLQRAYGAVRETLQAEPGRWRSVLEVEIRAVTVPPQRYPGFVRFIHAVDELVTRPPRFRARVY